MSVFLLFMAMFSAALGGYHAYQLATVGGLAAAICLPINILCTIWFFFLAAKEA